MDPTGIWIVDYSDVVTEERLEIVAVDSLGKVGQPVSKLFEANTSGRLDIGQDIGQRNWYARVIQRLDPRNYRWHVHLEWYESFCSLIFMDEYASEYRAMDPEFDGNAVDERIRSMISHGDLKSHPVEEYMTANRAHDAMCEYWETLERPEWLHCKHCLLYTSPSPRD